MADVSPVAAQVLAVDPPVLQAEDGLAGEAITAGQWVYFDSATSTYKLADNDNGAARAAMRGCALNSAAIGQPVRINKNGGKVKLATSGVLTIGVPYFLSSTPGAICLLGDLTAGDYVVLAGIATSTTEILIQLINVNVQVPA